MSSRRKDGLEREARVDLSPIFLSPEKPSFLQVKREPRHVWALYPTLRPSSRPRVGHLDLEDSLRPFWRVVLKPSRTLSPVHHLPPPGRTPGEGLSHPSAAAADQLSCPFNRPRRREELLRCHRSCRWHQRWPCRYGTTLDAQHRSETPCPQASRNCASRRDTSP